MAEWFKPVPAIDRTLANEMVDSVFQKRELLDPHGELMRSDLAERLKDLFLQKHVVEVNELQAISATAVTKPELAKEFLALDGGDTVILKATSTDEERAARSMVISTIWEVCGTQMNSPVNKKLNYLGAPVLMEATVSRYYTSAQKEDLGEVAEDRQGRFMSTNIEIILMYSNNPAVKRLKQAASRYDAFLGTIGDRLPQHRERLAAEAAAALPQVIEAVANAKLVHVPAMAAITDGNQAGKAVK
jgi:hypothetical protein